MLASCVVLAEAGAEWQAIAGGLMSRFKNQEAVDNALVWSIQFKDLDRVKKLLAAGADVHCRGEAPCFNAVSFDWIECLVFLLEKGAQAKKCPSALLGVAAGRSTVQVMEILIREGVRPGYWGWTGLGAAAAHGRWKEAGILAREIFIAESQKGDGPERVMGRLDMLFAMIESDLGGRPFVESKLRPKLKRIVQAAALKAGH